MFGRMLIAATGLAVAVSTTPTAVKAAEEVNLYSYRQEFLLAPLLEAFQKETGIKTNVVYVDGGVLNRMLAEGQNSPADAVLTVDIGRLHDHYKADTLQPVKSEYLEKRIPAAYRHPEGYWYGLSIRSRVIYHSKDRVNPSELSTYEALADPKWKGRICTRQGSHVYMVSLLASIIEADGMEKAEQWAQGVKQNLARKPQGNDRAQSRAIMEGVCDIALANTYYYGKMKQNPEQQPWADAVKIYFPNQEGRGAHVNISGAGVAKHAKNPENAIKLIEFLAGDKAQHIYASDNMEYPIVDGVEWPEEVKSWGDFKPDETSLAAIAEHRADALKIFNKVGYDEGPGT
ncbi:MAG: Fe(3+) ABC transporter substrate-binding protein [Acetobacterales bacterium]